MIRDIEKIGMTPGKLALQLEPFILIDLFRTYLNLNLGEQWQSNDKRHIALL